MSVLRLLKPRILMAAKPGTVPTASINTSGMDAAMRLYTDAGFVPLCAPLGQTGHFACDRYYLRDL